MSTLNTEALCGSFFHLTGVMLGIGSILLPGNYGRIVRRVGWRHSHAMREIALENARLVTNPAAPSRLDCIFVMPTLEEANRFRFPPGEQAQTGFEFHNTYRVRLAEPDAAHFVTDWRHIGGSGDIMDWGARYWRGVLPADAVGGAQTLCREMLTLSPVIVEERID